MSYHVVDDSIFSYVRYNTDSDDVYLVAINFGNETEERSYVEPFGNPELTVSIVLYQLSLSVCSNLCLWTI